MKTTLLSNRWPGARRLPWIGLAEAPTPVERLDALGARVGAELWIKRDDLTHPRYGGNKVRKLEYLLGEALAQEANAVITTGAAGSHHALATALFGRTHGLEVHAVLFPQRYSSHAEAHLKALRLTGAEVHPTRSAALAVPGASALSARLRLSRRRPFVIPPGGSSPTGVLGYVEAGLELGRQTESGVLDEPDVVVAPFGTGGTVAGLAVGLAAAGLTCPVVGVRVVPRSVANRPLVGRLIRRAVGALRSLDARFPDVADDARRLVQLDHDEYGKGYGEPTSEGRNASRLAREHAGLTLDPTYTAKAFAALLRLARGPYAGRRLLYLHTLSHAAPPGVEHAPPLPPELRRLLKR